MTIEEGVEVGGESATSGDALRTSMTDAQNVINLIDEIAKTGPSRRDRGL